MKMIYTFPNGLRFEAELVQEDEIKQSIFNRPDDLEMQDWTGSAAGMFEDLRILTARYGNATLQIES